MCKNALSLALLLTSLGGALATDWPHWRGPNRNGVVAASSGWRGDRWLSGDPGWTRSVGEGSTSPLVVGGRLYTMGWREGRDVVQCLDVATGAPRWSVSYPCSRYGRRATGDQGIYSGPSSTPEFDSATAYLYTLSIDGHLNCWDTRQEGKKVWGLNLYDTFDVPQRPRVGRSGLRDYGYTSSPLVHGDWLIVEVGAREGNLMAFDKRSGKRVWTSEATSPAGHNGGPVPMIVEGVPCVAVHNHDGLLVVRLDPGHAGKTVATWPWVTSFANNIATATVHGRFVLLTSSYNQHKIAKFEISLQGAKKVWEQEHASKVCSPVIHAGHVYWAWNRVMCLDFDTGALKWQGGRVGDQGSCLVTADGRLVVWANRGDLLLVETAQRSPGRYTELATRTGLGRSDAWPHVVLAGEKLYCKDRSGLLLCLDPRASGPAPDPGRQDR
jgi:outer membrane protein assembly factor BamB